MILDGRGIVEKGLLQFPDTLFDNEKAIQPNGVDLRAHKIYQVMGRITLERDKRIDTSNARIVELQLKDGFWDLDHTECNYLVDFRETCRMRPKYSAQVVSRSSLLRTGILVTSAWWDTGWDGRLGASIRIRNFIKIEYAAALAQLIVHESVFNGHEYTGQYQGKDSQVVFR